MTTAKTLEDEHEITERAAYYFCHGSNLFDRQRQSETAAGLLCAWEYAVSMNWAARHRYTFEWECDPDSRTYPDHSLCYMLDAEGSIVQTRGGIDIKPDEAAHSDLAMFEMAGLAIEQLKSRDPEQMALDDAAAAWECLSRDEQHGRFETDRLESLSREQLKVMIYWNDCSRTFGKEYSHTELVEIMRDMRIDSSQHIQDALSSVLRSWCAINKLDFESAETLLSTDGLREKQRKWLRAYCILWDLSPVGV